MIVYEFSLELMCFICSSRKISNQRRKKNKNKEKKEENEREEGRAKKNREE